MSDGIHQVLEECLELLCQGIPLEECLAQYLEDAEELEPLLRTALAAQRDLTPGMSPGARAQLQARVLGEWDRRSLPKQRPWGLPAFFPRWAAVAVSVVVALLLGGVGTVAAAGGALPGDLLYPVKLTTEQARLAFTLSDTGKARLHIELAERRVSELTEAAYQGTPERVAALPQSIAAHLAKARQATEGKTPDKAMADLAARLEQSAISQLAVLEVLLDIVPEGTKTLIEDAFSEAGSAYGAALDAVPSPPPEPVLVARLGTLQIRVTDPPPPDVDQVLIELQNIQVHKAAGPDSGWITIAAAPVTFDLLRVEEIAKFLGARLVDEGTYTQVRLNINSVNVVVGDETHSANLPGDTLKVVRPFRVQEDETTVLVLDFNGLESLTVTGEGEFTLTPVVKALVPTATEAARQEAASRQGGADRAQPAAPGQAGAQPGDISPSGLELKETKGEIEGPISHFGETQWVVLGLPILIDENTEVKGTPGIGLKAEAEVILLPNGDLLAMEIKVTGKDEGEDEFEIEGAIDAFDPNQWVIGGQTVLVDGQTEIKGTPDIGLNAKAEGIVQPNGDLLATEIKVKGEDEGEAEFEIKGAIDAFDPNQWVIGGRTVLVDGQTEIKGTPDIGLKAKAEGIVLPNGDLLATEIKVKGEDDGEAEFEIEGAIDAFDQDQWVIGGQTVLVDGQTEIKGTPDIGIKAEAEGAVLPNGDFLATEIEVKGEDDQDDEDEDEVQPGSTTLLFSPSEVEIFSGGTFSVTVWMRGVIAPGLAAYAIGITFDPSVIQINSVVGLDSDFGEPLAANIDNTTGNVNLADLITAEEGPVGNISLVQINGTAIAEATATTSLEFTGIDLTDPNGDPLAPLVTINGEIKVLVPGGEGDEEP